jgi:hypothetical protein
MIIAVLAASFMAHAQTSTTTTTTTSTQSTGTSAAKVTDLQKKDEQMKDIDQEITNNKMRAEMGSKSKWSLRSSLGYSGGTVQKAFSERRPNITQGPNADSRAYMSADLAIKYRTGDRTSLNAGTGLKVITPFHRTFNEATNSNTNSAPASRRAKLSSVSNPYIEFNYAGKLGSVQNFAQVTGTYASEDFDRNIVGTTGNIAISDQLIMEIGNNSLGLAATIAQNLYKDSSNTYMDGGEAQAREDMGVYAVPFYEYAFNDKYNFRTVFNWVNFSKELGSSEFRQLKPQQSMGLGISVSRDVFLYPNIQFIPQDIRADRTNVALSASINLF